MFLGILPMILNVLILVSIFLYLVPKETLNNLLGKNSGALGISITSIIVLLQLRLSKKIFGFLLK